MCRPYRDRRTNAEDILKNGKIFKAVFLMVMKGESLIIRETTGFFHFFVLFYFIVR